MLRACLERLQLAFPNVSFGQNFEASAGNRNDNMSDSDPGFAISPPSSVASTRPQSSHDDSFSPSCAEVFETRRILQGSMRSPSAPNGFPVELLDIIIDKAEYWPFVETSLTERISIQKDGDRQCLRTLPLCYDTVDGSTSPQLQPHRGIHPCRKVEFSIRANDQGWGGGPNARGTYNGSYSWFDAHIISNPDYALSDTKEDSFKDKEQDAEAQKDQGKDKGTNEESGNDKCAENPDTDDKNEHEGDKATVEPEQDEASRFGMNNYWSPGPGVLQRNMVACREPKTYKFSWHYRDSIDPDSAEAEEDQNACGRGRATLDGKAVREMKVGDEISIWMRARYPGWRNELKDMRVRVYWGV